MEPKYRHTPLFNRILFRMRRQPRGQSFVELLMVVLFLMLLLSGMVEFGFLMNNYLHVLDGSREGARYASSQNAFTLDTTGVIISSYYFPPFYYQAAGKAAETMDPVMLNPTFPDDIVISVFSLTGTTPTRFPLTDPNGWSLCAHYNTNADDLAARDNLGNPYPFTSFATYFPSLAPPAPVPSELPVSTWGTSCHVRISQFTTASFTSLLGSVTLATPDTAPPNTGVVVVEIFYNYPQLLKLPVLTNVLPDPIPLYVYSVMPLSAAQPTQAPLPH